MTYHPAITNCPVCSVLKSPMATVCSNCYLTAKRDTELRVNCTGDLEVWVQLQRERLQVPYAPSRH